MRKIELVLELESRSATEWARQRAALAHREKRRGRGTYRTDEAAVEARTGKGRATEAEAEAEADAGTPDLCRAIADALKQADGIELLQPRAPEHRFVFEKRAGGWRVVFRNPSDEWRVLAVRTKAFVPGVMVRDTVCDEPLEKGVTISPSAALPQALKKSIRGDAELACTREIEIYRTVWQWSEPQGPSVEIVLHDGLDASASDPWVRANGMPAFCELHLSATIDAEQREAVASSHADRGGLVPESAIRALFAAARALVDLLPVLPSLTDAYARARGDAGSNEPVRAVPVDLASASTPHEALIAIGCNVAQHWLGNQQSVRDCSSSECVHQMRVALRRHKTMTKVFPRWIDDAWHEYGERDLKWIAALLGAVRDLDVFAESTLPTLIDVDVDASAWSGVRGATDERCVEARARLREALRSRRYAHLVLAWLDWLASQRYLSGPSALAGERLSDYAATRVRKHFRRLTAKPAITSLDADARHRRRIEAKRLRYALEFFEPLVSKKDRRELSTQLGRIQSVLGEGSDAVAALRFLEQLDVPAYQLGFARGWGQAVNRCAAREAEQLLDDLCKPKIARRN